MADKITKICPILTAGLLWGRTTTRTDPFTPKQSIDAIRCYKEQCAVWDENNKCCGLRLT